MKSACSRSSATVACTSTPANSVSRGVATTSRVPSAVVPTNTILSVNVPAGVWPLSTSAAATIAQQQIALAVERHGPAVEEQRGGVHVDHAKTDVVRPGRPDDGRERE